VIDLVQVGVADAVISTSIRDIVRTQITPLERKGDNGVSDDCAASPIVLMVSLSPSYIFLL
jgi:hypothetical protein